MSPQPPETQMPSTARTLLRQRLAVVLVTVLVVQVLELSLLQRKYDLFTGGFLQPYAYLTTAERLRFLGAALWMDLIFFGTLALIWFRLADWRRIPPAVAAYDCLFLCVASMGLWLTLKFKVLAYFNDTINFLIVRNLGGGSLVEALRYVADESVLFVAGTIALAVVYWAGRRLMYRRAKASPPPARRGGKALPALVVTAALVTVALAYWINTRPDLRYGMARKTSYQLIADLLDRASDLDGDGYGLFRFPVDTDNADPRIHPGALDIPGNGIDEDGYGGDFTADVAPPPDRLAQLEPRPGRHILLVVLESARGDLVGKSWKGQPVAPVMTRLARQGTHVKSAYSHTGYTVTSLKALFNRTLSRHADRQRLADHLDRAGYLLSFISGQDESFGNVAADTHMKGNGHYYFDARTAIDDRVYPSKDPGSLRLSEERVLRQFRRRVAETDWSRPNFFYVNLQAAHFPYSYPGMPALIIDHPLPRRQIRPENREALQGTYWNAIAVADRTVGAMLDTLRQQGVLEDTLVVILGDHGESLFDDDFLGHGHALNDIQTRIPLLVNQPDLPIAQAVGQVDVAELVVTLATGRFDPARWADPETTQFQFVGSLDRPQQICTVRAGGVRTLLDLRTRKVFFSDLRRWEDFDTALADPDLGPRTRHLLHTWENLRWRNHLARRTDGSAASARATAAVSGK